MELVKGCRDKREVSLLRQRIAAFPIFWPTEDDYYRALAVYVRAHLSHRLGLLDAIIGECAVGLSAVLCTFNIRHHRANPDVITEQPYSRP